MSHGEQKIDISVVIPVYNEAESVAPLHKELVDVLGTLGRTFEIIFIDDGSTDETLKELKKLSPVSVISFTGNFGKSQALQAGFDAARGEYVITMDGDLQDDPAEIPNFLKEMNATKSDLVCGWKQRRNDIVTKRIVSKFANAITRSITKTTVHDMNCCFKIYRGEVARRLRLYGDMHRYIPSIVVNLGYAVTEMPVNHRARKYGVSKYGFTRLFSGLFDFLTLVFLRKFTDRPMYLFGAFGTALFSVGMLILVYLSGLKLLTGALIGDRPLLLLGVLMVLLGFQSLSIGFLGELVIRHGDSSRRSFVVREQFVS